MTSKDMRDEYGNKPFRMSEEHIGVKNKMKSISPALLYLVVRQVYISVFLPMLYLVLLEPNYNIWEKPLGNTH